MLWGYAHERPPDFSGGWTCTSGGEVPSALRAVIIEEETFRAVQAQIQSKTAIYTPAKPRPALHLKEYLRCERCGCNLHRTAGANRRPDTLYLKCNQCGMQVTISDDDLLAEINRQLAERDAPAGSYTPSGEVVRLANAINRSLERPDAPEDVVSLILQGVSARYGGYTTATWREPAWEISRRSWRPTVFPRRKLSRAGRIR